MKKGQTKPSAKSSKLPGSPGKLNVILHGLFDFDQETKKDGKGQDQISVYIPDVNRIKPPHNMGAGHKMTKHVFKAGNWLAETTLERGKFVLKGVAKGSTENKLSPDRNMIVGKDLKVNSNRTNTYATLVLPYPALPIQSLRRLTIPANGLSGKSKKTVLNGSKNVQNATVQVLTYSFESDAELALGDHPWEPVLEGGYVNLHVFSEPEKNPTEEHLRHAFEASMKMFDDVDLELTRPAQPANYEAEKSETPPGVHSLELEDLVRRQGRLAVLGRAIKEPRDLNTIWDEPTPFEGNSAGACSGDAGTDS
jgi:hypothetical protein